MFFSVLSKEKEKNSPVLIMLAQAPDDAYREKRHSVTSWLSFSNVTEDKPHLWWNCIIIFIKQEKGLE